MKQIDPDNLKFAILATDVALFTLHNNELLIRITKLDRPHIKEVKSLPGGLILPEKTALESAKIILRDKAGIDTKKLYFEQLYTFSEIDRDPRGRVVAVAYSAYIPWEKLTADERANTTDVWWSPVSKTGKLGYDHDKILTQAIERLKTRVEYTTLIQKMLPTKFTLTEMEEAYRVLLNKNIDKRNFRKKILKLDILKKLDLQKIDGAHRPASLYTFKQPKVQNIDIL